MIDREDFIRAMGEPDAGFDAAVDAALSRIAKREERPAVKKKLTVTLIAAAAAVLLLTGAALAVGMNLFEYFGAQDARLREIAPEATLSTGSSGTVETEALGATECAFNCGYYDGESLILGYTLKNSVRCAPYAPTDAELAKMTPEDDCDGPILPPGLEEIEAGGAFVRGFDEAAAMGEPCGIAVYHIVAQDRTFAADGTELPLSAVTEDNLPDGTLLILQEYETPLPGAARDLDRLDVRIPLYAETLYWVFDGERLFSRTVRGDAPVGEIAATVPRTKSVRRTFSGEGTLGGVPVKVTAHASAVRADVQIVADGASIPSLDAGEALGYALILEDEAGRELRWSSLEEGPDRASADFNGTGFLPEALTLTVRRPDLDAGEAIPLKPVE